MMESGIATIAVSSQFGLIGRLTLRLFLVLLTFLFAAFCPASFATDTPFSESARSAAQAKGPERVLILTQEDVSWPIFRLIDDNARATLRAGSPEGILIFDEHLDRVNFQNPAILTEQLAWIKRKYAKSHLDLVISVGDVPPGLFPGVPLVFLSDDPRRTLPYSATSPTSTTSVWIDISAQKTLELAQRLQPGARHIIVIGDSAPSEDTVLNRLRRTYPTNAGNVPISYLTNLAVPEICQRVSQLISDSIVIFTGLWRDDHGQPLVSEEVISKIAAASGAPVYTIYDTHVGTGALGGYMASFAEVGKTGGQLGLRVIAGEHPQDVVAENVFLFDWRQLRRWKISESALPPGSHVLYHQPSIWERDRNLFLGGIALLLLQALLIFGLLWQRANRRKVEQSIVEQLAFERLVSDLSTTFVNLPEEQVGEKMQKSLGRIAEFLRMDRIAVHEFSKEETELMVTLSWRAEGVEPVPDVVNASQFPWWTPLFLRGETAYISRLNELPEEAAVECKYLRSLGTVSAATVPLKAGEELYGCMSFVSTKREVAWSEELVSRLKIVAEIFSNALMRKRTQETRRRHAAIVESSDDAIVSKNLEGLILSWNAGAQRMFGFTEADAVGQPITIIVPPERYDEETVILQRLRAGERVVHFETMRQTKEGKKINVSLTVSPMKDSMGKVVGVSKIARDITDRKQAEQTLKESEERFRRVANTAPVLIWMSGTDMLCTFFNQSWLDFTGQSLEHELGNGWAAGVHPEDLEHCLQIYSGAFNARVDFEMEYRLRHSDGKYRWIIDYGVPRFESDGTFCGYIGSCVDITQRKLTEESLEDLSGRLITAQEEERTRIARELHDDFSQRLALQGIGLGQLWKQLPVSEVEGRARIQELLMRVQEMSSDMHSLSHQLHSSKLEYVGLAPALRGLCEEMSSKYDISVEFSERCVPIDIPKGVALCLFRIAQEALSNVVKHSRAKQSQVELSGANNELCLRIVDSGLGFDPGLRAAHTGIGVVGMRERLRLVGGTLSVHSAPMQGTEILAQVPLTASVNETKVSTWAAGG